ncbi:MAG: 1-acyl-sn-glycerol-3-phosphate acyltransferase, partial [Flavobacteriaceae bacterium]
MHGLETLPKDSAIMILPNHQNALLDALLIAAYSRRAPYFLTRSDVFTNTLVKGLFKLLRMLPIYRIRDGRDSLNKNHEIFDICTRLLNAREAIVVFPEANHNSKRMVRPLSKGFTRILFQALEKHPDLDIGLIPVGVNYVDLSGFPDSAAFFFGKHFQLKELYNSGDLRTSSSAVRQRVSDEIKSLTTHIGPELRYDDVIAQLDRMQVNYLDPQHVNALIEDLPFDNLKEKDATSSLFLRTLWDVPFYIF